MAFLFCISVRFLQPIFCGRGEGEPEWPPSPLRLFQALTASASAKWNERIRLDHAGAALRWLEALQPPFVVAPLGTPAARAYRLYVPDNIGDIVAASWSRGRTANIADYRTEKDVQPTYIAGDTVYYVYCIADNASLHHCETLTTATRSITHLGWGSDMVVANGALINQSEYAALLGERYLPSDTDGSVQMRVAQSGTLDDLIRRHESFLNRIVRDSQGGESFNPVPPLSVFHLVRYRRVGDPVGYPHAIFELRKNDGTRFSYPQRRLIHIAGMVRHLAVKVLKHSQPPGVPTDWLETYVAGHAPEGAVHHRRFSYVPLPSIGHAFADQSIRRMMIVAPRGDDHLLNHLVIRLSGQQLKPTDETRIDNPPLLHRSFPDRIAQRYVEPTTTWTSVTPVILPGHDDHKPQKTRRLIESALRQSGIEQPCEFDWSPISRFAKSFSAHKYDRHGRAAGYIRPNHLLSQTAVHLTIRFQHVALPGPLIIGAGRHYGFGLMAGIDPDSKMGAY